MSEDKQELILDEAVNAGTEGDVEVVEVVDVDERAESEPAAASVNYFGTDFDVHGLVRRLRDGDIVIPTFDPGYPSDTDIRGFQRQFVWRRYQMDRFIESLLLGYPVPGIFLVQQPDKKLLVLDGQQRLKTLEQFYDGEIYSGKQFELDAVADAFKGMTYESLAEEDRRQLDNTFIHAIVVKYDPESDQEAEAVYQLFERLNTGGTNLYPQEIRVALYPGVFVDFVRELNRDDNWRVLYGPPSGRLKDQELILRFFALYQSGDKYSRPLKSFLNDFLKDHRQGGGLDLNHLAAHFRATCATINNGLGRRAFRTANAVNAALVDAVMVAIARRLEAGPVADLESLQAPFETLVKDDDFDWAIGRATADEERVERRLAMATKAFADIT
jgi:Protein of unknown function DUF262